MFTEKIAYTLPSDAYYYTSLETMTHVFGVNICFRKEFYKMLVRIFLHHKQAHLFGTIVVTKKLNLIGNLCLNSHRIIETHFLLQSASTEAIFLQLEICMHISLCSEKIVSHDSSSIESRLLKEIRR